MLLLLLNGVHGGGVVGGGEEGGWWERVRGTGRRCNKDQQQVQPLDHGKRISWGELRVTVIQNDVWILYKTTRGIRGFVPSVSSPRVGFSELAKLIFPYATLHFFTPFTFTSASKHIHPYLKDFTPFSPYFIS